MIILLMSGSQQESNRNLVDQTEDVIVMPRTTHSQHRKDKRKMTQSIKTDETLRLAAKGLKQRGEQEDEVTASYFQA